MWYYDAEHPLRRYFSGLAEHTFASDPGVADPPLIDYLSLLLSRFVIEHRLREQTSASLKAQRWEDEAADLLLSDAPVPLATAASLLER